VKNVAVATLFTFDPREPICNVFLARSLESIIEPLQ
jgi:hypothetical protein